MLHANGDVLVLLDCCHAATKTHGSFDNGQMEILAASSSGARVPKPGRLSFTSVLIREIRKQITAGKDVPIRWLQNHLWDNLTQPALTESPQYFTLANNDAPTIRLAPLPLPVPAGFSRKHELPSSFALLSISFREDPKAQQIADWLKSYPQNIVSDVSIESLILKARLLQGLTGDGQILTGSILGSLSASAQAEILDRIAKLSNAMLTSAFLAQTAPSSKTESGKLTEEVAGDIKLESLKDIDKSVCALTESIEEGVLLDPNIDLSIAQDDQIIAACGVDKAISLRQRLLSSSIISEQLELPRGSIVWDRSSNRGPRDMQSKFRIGKIQNHPVIAEIFEYELLTDNTESQEPSPTQLQQLKKMTTQLCHPKRTSFHILPGLGYIHERSAKSFSLVFELDMSFDSSQAKGGVSFATLSDYMSKQKRVPLGSRIQLAFTLAEAIENFHKVGWVHKLFKSSNVVFFYQKPESGNVNVPRVDIHRPWLFGFEYSRPEDAETALKTDYSVENNVYMHPERWGRPLAKFSKAHDVYSLGIVMMEIAYWKSTKEFPEMRQRRLDPENIKAAILQRLIQDGPHVCGQRLSDSIQACLSFKELTEELSDLESHKVFKAKILSPLKDIGGNV